MKKRVLSIVLALTLGVVAFTGCSKSGSANSASGANDKVIKVGASVTPHAEILEQIKDDLAAEGWTLEIVEYNDYVIPNTALENGDLDANYFQHKPYLDDFNAENGTHISAAIAVHFEPMGVYAGKSSDLSNVADGAVIAVPNDTTNEARALLLLEAQGLIKLKDGVGVQATVLDIEENPKNIEIKELEAAQIAKAIKDVDFAVLNGNYAIEAGLGDAIAVEASDSLAADTYANYVCVREGEESSEKTEALRKAILSEKVKSFIEDNYQGAVLPVF